MQEKVVVGAIPYLYLRSAVMASPIIPVLVR
jgi:hypothetical protein